MISIEDFGFENNEQVIKYIIDNIDTHHKEMLHWLGDVIINEARSNLQNNTNINSGHLLSSIRILEEVDDYIIIGTDVEYAGYIEYGRGPVRPLKEGGWLHWIDKSSGKDVFAKFANATEPSPFMEPAVIKYTKDFPQIYAEKIEEKL